MYDFPGPLEHGCVYFIACPATQTVKIGYSNYDEPFHRLKYLRATHAVPLYLIGWLPMGGRQLERRVHRHFGGHRVHGEWFDLSNKWVQCEIGRIIGLDGVEHDEG